jgi:hypothetical protein
MMVISDCAPGLGVIPIACQHALHAVQLSSKDTYRLDELPLQQRRQRQLHGGGVAPRVGHQASAPAGHRFTCRLRVDYGAGCEDAEDVQHARSRLLAPRKPSTGKLARRCVAHLMASRLSSVRPYTASFCSSLALCSPPYLQRARHLMTSGQGSSDVQS